MSGIFRLCNYKQNIEHQVKNEFFFISVLVNKVYVFNEMGGLSEALDFDDESDSISLFYYISHLTSNFLLHDELETVSIITYKSLKNIPMENVLNMLKDAVESNYIVFRNHRIQLHDKWFFQVTLLSSFRHCKELFNKNSEGFYKELIKNIVIEIVKLFSPTRYESIQLLRLIDNILKKQKHVLDTTLSLHLLNFVQKVALSPYEGFKRYAHSMSKVTLTSLDFKYIKGFLDLDMLPIKGIETSELVPYFQMCSNDKDCGAHIVAKVIQMFGNNIENRDGSFLYKSVLFENFKKWTDVVWPQFSQRLEFVDCEGEFFQSLVKYWIPQTVITYKLHFYEFIQPLSLPNFLKGSILLETRKRGYINQFNNNIQLHSLFRDKNTCDLALKIVSYYHKKNVSPSEFELNFVRSYLYCCTTEPLQNEEIISLQRFVSQVFLTGHEMLTTKNSSEYLLQCYEHFANDIFKVCYETFKSNNKEVAAQIAYTMWNIGIAPSDGLCLNYKLEKCLSYGEGENSFYKYLVKNKVGFDGARYLVTAERLLLTSSGNYFYWTKLIILLGKLYTLNKLKGGINKMNNKSLLDVIHKYSDSFSIKCTKIVKNYTSIVVKSNSINENFLLLKNLLEDMNTSIKRGVKMETIFKNVLILEAILEIPQNIYENNHLNYEIKLVMKESINGCFAVMEYVLNNDLQNIQETMDSNDLLLLHYKTQKVLEAFFNGILQYLIQEKSVWGFIDKNVVLKLLSKIIETSNMRRPTSLGADVLKLVGKLIEEKKDETQLKKDFALDSQILSEKEVKNSSVMLQYLHRTLEKLYDVSIVQNLTIRRNPESRLAVHAMCVSNKHPQKPILIWTLHQLLDILSNPESIDSTVSSALHCTEILMSDNSLHNHTLQFVPDVILQCVHLFVRPNWVVRNANIQLAKALIDRFLGVLIGPNNRPKTIEDLFLLFPPLVPAFCHILCQNPLTDSAVMIMQFFFESQARKQPYHSEFSRISITYFMRIFSLMIKERSDHYGIFAVRAFVSLCIETEIPFILLDVVEFIIENLDYIRNQNTLKHFVFLVKDLYNKYLEFDSNYTSAKSAGLTLINIALGKLSIVLKASFDSRKFDFLLFKILSLDDVLTVLRVSHFDRSDFENRLWQHNYLPYLIINNDEDIFLNNLTKILSKDILDCMQVKILCIIIEKLEKRQFNIDFLSKIVLVLINQSLQIIDSKNYLLQCYYKVISLFLKITNMNINISLLNSIRNMYNMLENIYKKYIFVMVLTQTQNKSSIDQNFLQTVLQSCQKNNFHNEEMAETMSEMLPYFYKSLTCVCDKYRVFKLAVHLLLDFGLWDFANFITKTKIPSALVAMASMFKFDLLIKCFENNFLAYRFVKQFYECILRRDLTWKENCRKTYYVEEENVFVDRCFIDKIVVKFLIDLNMREKNYDWITNYKNLIKGKT